MFRGIAWAVILSLGVASAENAWGQGTGGTGGTGGIGGTNATSGTSTIGSGTTGTTIGLGTGGTANGLNSGPLQLGDLITFGPEFTRESMFENDRIQPFVGPSSANIVHPRSQIDPAGSTMGSSGSGGFTFSTQGQSRTQAGRGTSGFGGQGTTSQQGFTVSRRGVRSAVRYSPIASVSGTQIASNFVGRLSRLPSLQNVGAIEFKVENRVAILNGIVANPEQKTLIARQAELEPGVSRVINNLEVAK